MTQSRHKVVNLILRKCAIYQEMGRSYTFKVGTKINLGRPYTIKEKWIDRTLLKSEICLKSYFLKISTFGAKKMLNLLIDLIARFSLRLFIVCVT